MMEKISIAKISFSRKPISLPAEYRSLYKISLIVLILKLCCRGEKSNLIKLHLFSWALTSQENMEELRRYILNSFHTPFSVWSIEPTLNRALVFAVAEKICEYDNVASYKLTEKGNTLFELIHSDKDLLSMEKSFLTFVGKNKITDNRIQSMTNKWEQNVKN